MKPTEKQKKIIDCVINNLRFWKSTNDINSPSHNSLVEDEVNELVMDDVISDEEGEMLTDVITTIRYNILKFKE